MSYRIQGIINAFEKDTTLAVNQTVGKLVRVMNSGKVTTGTGEGNKLFFPITEPIDAALDTAVAAQVSGIAMCYVETAASITAGVRVGVGATFAGVAAEGANPGFILGVALKTPAGDGDMIPVLLTPSIDEIV